MRMLRIDSWSLLNTIKRLATCSLLVGQLLSLEMRQTQLSTSYLASNQNTSLYHGDLWIFCKLISKPFLFPLAYSLGYLEDNEQGWPAMRPAFPRSSALNHISLSLPEASWQRLWLVRRAAAPRAFCTVTFKSYKQLSEPLRGTHYNTGTSKFILFFIPD